MKVMTKQQIFDTVATHLLKQKKVAKNKGGCCAYRGKNGTKCAAGCLIPNELYAREFEGRAIFAIFDETYDSMYSRSVQEKGSALRKLWGTKNRALISSLQAVHDGSDVDGWPMRLKTIARDFKLKLPKCLQIKENP